MEKNTFEFKDKQNKLASIIDETSVLMKELSLNEYTDELESLSKKLYDESFRILVNGTLKNGKSTLVNALLGKEILPTYYNSTFPLQKA